MCFKFGRAGIDPLEGRNNAERLPRVADISLGAPGQNSQTAIGEAHHFNVAQPLFILGQTFGLDDCFDLYDFANARQEPRIKAGDAVQLIIGKSEAHRMSNDPHPVWRLDR